MTNTEQKALALWNEARTEKGLSHWTMEYVRSDTSFLALCRAIERHEADKKAFSDALRDYFGCQISDVEQGFLGRFILPEPEPDPLVEALEEAWFKSDHKDERANELRKALTARGWKIERIEQ